MKLAPAIENTIGIVGVARRTARTVTAPITAMLSTSLLTIADAMSGSRSTMIEVGSVAGDCKFEMFPFGIC